MSKHSGSSCSRIISEEGCRSRSSETNHTERGGGHTEQVKGSERSHSDHGNIWERLTFRTDPELVEVKIRSGWDPEGRWFWLEGTEKWCWRITDNSKKDRPVKKHEKMKKASRKTGRIATHGNILRCNHNWFLSDDYSHTHAGQSCGNGENANKNATDASPGGVQSSRQGACINFPADFSQSPS